jgi:hypothetical protein
MHRVRRIEDLLAHGDYALIDAVPGNPWPLRQGTS